MKNSKKNETILKKAAIYCRVSTKEQVDEGNSLVSQERVCREYATKEGYEVVEVFIEKGESAKTADRKELKRLLSFCTAKKGNVHAVIAYKVDRISRNIADYSHIRVLLKKHGIEIRSVTEFFEDTPAGRFMENIIANVSQFDNDVRTERSLGGMKEAVKEGRYVWTAPKGYSNVKINGKSTIAPNEFALLMKEAFELIAQRRYSTDVIRLQLAEKGLVNKMGRPLTCSTFFQILRNPIYKGKIKKFGEVFQGTFDAIVSEDLFDDVQNILKGRKNKVKHYLHENPDFPLRRFVFSEQGKQLTGYWSKGKRLKYPYYSFQIPRTTIRKEVLESKFMDLLAQYRIDSRFLSLMRKNLIKYFQKQTDTHEQDKEQIKTRIGEINGLIDNLIKLQTEGSISTNIFTDRIQKFDQELEDLKKHLYMPPVNNVNIPDLLKFAAEVLKNPDILWLRASLEQKRQIQVFDFPEGVIFNGENFRTPKMWSIFKLKDIIDGENFVGVPSKYTGKNTLCKTNLPPSAVKLIKSRAFWEEVLTDLSKLQDIMAGKDKEKDNDPLKDEYWWMAA
jgi:site-specific DNA recombinase